jgi:hypothetical protein
VITVFIDHDIEGQAALLLRTLESQGWVEMGLLQVATFSELSLPVETSDREVWRFAQRRRMLLLTGNRNMTGEDSLEQTIRDENRPDSIPVVAIGNVNRVVERAYREECATRLASICLDVESYLGTGRLFIP